MNLTLLATAMLAVSGQPPVKIHEAIYSNFANEPKQTEVSLGFRGLEDSGNTFWEPQTIVEYGFVRNSLGGALFYTAFEYEEPEVVSFNFNEQDIDAANNVTIIIKNPDPYSTVGLPAINLRTNSGQLLWFGNFEPVAAEALFRIDGICFPQGVTLSFVVNKVGDFAQNSSTIEVSYNSTGFNDINPCSDTINRTGFENE